MYKFIFILFVSLCSLNSFGQQCFLNNDANKSDITAVVTEVKKEKDDRIDETVIDLLFNDNLCEILSIKPSDLLDEEMLKKLKATA